MQYVKKIIPLCIFITGIFSANAQKDSAAMEKGNIFKVNLSSLVFKNFSVQYERRVSRKSTIALGVHLLPFGSIPFKSTVKNIIDDPNTDIDNLKVGVFGIVPEYRIYLGRKGAFHGFYLGVFGSYNSYKTDLPIKYDNDTKTGIFTGNISTYTGGLQIGSQWQLSKSIYLDFWILGPNYGGGSGKVVFTGTLDYYEQSALSVELQQLKDDVPFHVIKSYSVNGDGSTINVKGPWVGLRGGGFNLGFRF